MAGVQFEVQTYNNGKWAISEVVPTEESARAKADSLLAQKNVAGVRIVKESHFASDARRESEIFKKIKHQTVRFRVTEFPGVSQFAKDLVLKLLERDINKRFSCSQALEH